jgi:Sap, sulfolipid-1-addressing protein
MTSHNEVTGEGSIESARIRGGFARMWQALGQILPIAVAVALSSVPIMATILILLSPKRDQAAVPFLIGWILGLAVIVTIFAFTAQLLPLRSGRQPAVAAGIAQVIVGLALIAFALITWRRAAEKPTSDEIPKWLRAVGSLGRWSAFGVAFGLNLRPKALLLAAAVGLSIRGNTLDVATAAIVLGVYVVISATTVAIPIIATLLAPNKTERWLIATKDWMTRNNRLITILIMILIGVVIAGDGLTRL